MNVNTHTLKLLVYEASFNLNTPLTLLGYGFLVFFFQMEHFHLVKFVYSSFQKHRILQGHFLCTALFNSLHRCSVYSCLGSGWAISQL